MIKTIRAIAYVVLVAAALLAAGAAQSYFSVGYIPSGMKNLEMLFSVPMLVALTASVLVLKFTSTSSVNS